MLLGEAQRKVAKGWIKKSHIGDTANDERHDQRERRTKREIYRHTAREREERAIKMKRGERKKEMNGQVVSREAKLTKPPCHDISISSRQA